MAAYGLPEPVFADERGSFTATLYNGLAAEYTAGTELSATERKLLEFLRTPRSRKEIAEHLGLSSVNYALKEYIGPLLDKGLVKMTIPDKPRSHKQMFVLTGSGNKLIGDCLQKRQY